VSDTVTKKDSGPAALIIQPGAVGDLILTLPLIRLLKAEYGYQRVDVAGHLDRLTYLVGKTAIDQAISIDRHSLHALFIDPESFHLTEDDPLIQLFHPYELIVTFLSDEQGHFEQNLIMTALRTHSVEVVTLALRPPDDFRGHAAEFFIRQFADQMVQKPHHHLARFLQTPLLQVKPPSGQMDATPLADDKLKRYRRITLQPGSGGVGKCWPIENFCELAARLQQEDFKPLFLLGPAETERWGQEVVARLKAHAQIIQDIPLEQVVELLSESTAYIGNDSGISHLAGAMDLPSLVIFGLTDPQHWRPLGSRSLVCRSDQPKIPWPSVHEVLFQLLKLLT
jgi:ADP-heptose:LPS heptosyltransferase